MQQEALQLHSCMFIIPKTLANCHVINIYQGLHHQHPLFPQVYDKLIDVDGILCLYPLHHGVQCDEGACPAHTSTAVHQEEVLPAVRMCLPHSLDEVYHGDSIVWNTMVRPGQIMELNNL